MSKGLEALKNLEDYYIEKSDIITVYVGDTEECEIIEQRLKALEIIRKYGHFDNDTGDFIVHIPDGKNENKEYDLLKEVLC